MSPNRYNHINGLLCGDLISAYERHHGIDLDEEAHLLASAEKWRFIIGSILITTLCATAWIMVEPLTKISHLQFTGLEFSRLQIASILVFIIELAFYWRVYNIRRSHDGVFQRLYWAIMCVAPYCHCSVTWISPSAIETKPFLITERVILGGLRIAKDRIQKYKDLIALIKTMRQEVSVEFIQETQEGLEEAEETLAQIREHLSLFDVTDPDADDRQTKFDFRD